MEDAKRTSARRTRRSLAFFVEAAFGWWRRWMGGFVSYPVGALRRLPVGKRMSLLSTMCRRTRGRLARAGAVPYIFFDQSSGSCALAWRYDDALALRDEGWGR